MQVTSIELKTFLKQTVKVKHKKAAKLIMPSKKSAIRPVCSLIRAAKETNNKGTAKAIISYATVKIICCLLYLQRRFSLFFLPSDFSK